MVTNIEEKVGFALATKGLLPINGLRHRAEGGTSGWYFWLGEESSSDPDFFSPLHAGHLKQQCPEIIKFLGLPPGYRFLIVEDYLDVWFDESLVKFSVGSTKWPRLIRMTKKFCDCGTLWILIYQRDAPSQHLAYGEQLSWGGYL
jgi:hypothetical protein